jgi:pyridoxal phosphate enzyme (YggS family)
MGLRDRIQEVQKRIADAAARSLRQPDEITLLAVTKTLPIEIIREAYEAGLRDFGENRVQEALTKISGFPADIHWHLIGQLQTNKINKVIGKFQLIHSIDSLHLAEALSARLGGLSQEVLLEVNTSGEKSKSGIMPDSVEETVEKMATLPGLELRGLMTVGPLTDNPRKQRDAFSKLKELFEKTKERGPDGKGLSILSMGMSGDFEVAIEEGSTLVRVGTALFGARQ